MHETERLTGQHVEPTLDRPETDAEPIENNFPKFTLTSTMLVKARLNEIKISGYDFCRGCLVKFGAPFTSLFEDHHIIPQYLQTHPDLDKISRNKTVRLCATCHKIAHVIIKDSSNCQWHINFWEESELIKEIRKFRRLFMRHNNHY